MSISATFAQAYPIPTIHYRWIASDKHASAPESTPKEREALLASLDVAQIPLHEFKTYSFKVRQGISNRVITAVERALPHLAASKITNAELANRLNISLRDVVQLIIKLKNNGYTNRDFEVIVHRETIVPRQPTMKATLEVVERIQARLPEIEAGKLKLAALAEELNLSINTIYRKVKALKEGKEPASIALRKAWGHVTAEVAERIKARLPEIEAGKLTIAALAEELNLSTDTIRKKIKALKEGKEPASIALRKERGQTTSEAIERIEAQLPEIEAGKFTLAALAKELNLSEATIRRKVKALQDGKDLNSVTSRKIADAPGSVAHKVQALVDAAKLVLPLSPQVPVTPVKLADAELLAAATVE